MREGVARLRSTFHEIRNYRQVVRFLLARLLYNDGLITAFSFGAIYAQGTFGFSAEELLYFGIVLNVAAGVGSFAMGFLDDRVGGKLTVQVSIVGLLVASIFAVLAPNRTLFWVSALLLGLFVGPNQSASRSLMSRMVPDDKENEFFGFFAFSGKATSFVGPLALAVLNSLFNQRTGMAAIVVLLLAGFAVLWGLDEEEGISMAKRSEGQ